MFLRRSPSKNVPYDAVLKGFSLKTVLLRGAPWRNVTFSDNLSKDITLTLTYLRKKEKQSETELTASILKKRSKTHKEKSLQFLYDVTQQRGIIALDTQGTQRI